MKLIKTIALITMMSPVVANANLLMAGEAPVLVVKEIGSSKPAYMANFFTTFEKCNVGVSKWNETIEKENLGISVSCISYQKYMQDLGSFMNATTSKKYTGYSFNKGK